ncbi:hypothetical protein [Oculatella sp. LEGE 06141]|uniref:hypothetical protein n=1 Tax=Oculatella sp. LEGE 06141 TaxID=1828648 RepID=UPI0030D918D1
MEEVLRGGIEKFSSRFVSVFPVLQHEKRSPVPIFGRTKNDAPFVLQYEERSLLPCSP